MADAVAPALAARGVGFSFPPMPLGLHWLAGTSSRPVEVLRDVSFSLARGERVCLMGVNGAGKTTLLKVLLGLLTPTAGLVEGEGGPVTRRAMARFAGFVHPDERSFYWRLTVQENLTFFGILWGMDRQRARARALRTAEDLGLSDRLGSVFSELSTGLRQRVAIARALLHDPALLVMDEPTRSLDPSAAAHLREWLRGPGFAGRTALVATHQPAEARELASRCLVLAGGRLVWDGAVPGDQRIRELVDGAGP